ncbi:hypothetical protein KKB83_02305 [Patescibacteria group bacterium]|nr:hypothetical protein [Patescibacteria group bacterium]
MGRQVVIDTRRRRRRGGRGVVSLAAAGVRPARDGRVVISRWFPTAHSWWRRLGSQIVEDLPAAIRMQEHIESKYEAREILQIAAFISTAHDIEARLWRWKELSGAERDQIKTDFARLAQRFGTFQNEWKLRAGGHFDKAKSLIDSLGRTNPPSRAIMARAAVCNLCQRLENQISIIRGKIAARKKALQIEQERIRKVIRQTTGAVNSMLNTSLFRTLRGSQGQGRGATRRISQLVSDLGTIKFKPYLQSRVEAANALLAAQKAIRGGNIKSARTHLRTASRKLREMQKL